MWMFGDIDSTCDIPHRENLKRMENYEEAANMKDTEKLWNTFAQSSVMRDVM